MAEVRHERQKERAEAREGRRAPADEPSEQRDQSSLDIRRAAATAVTAALAGALAGAAKAIVDKRGRGATEPEADAGAREDDQETASDPEDEAERTDEHEDDDEPNEEPARASEEDGAQRQDNAREQDDDSEQTGASSDDVASIIARARQHVEAVIGSEAESVSGVERSSGNWRVHVEVVQMRRVPESTDILASYAVSLDSDGDLISVQEMRRYRRSQAEGDR